MYKLKLYIKQIFSGLTSNKVRFSIMIIGITLCMVIAICAINLYDIYNYRKQLIYKDFKNDEMIIEGVFVPEQIISLSDYSAVKDLALFNKINTVESTLFNKRINLALWEVNQTFLSVGTPCLNNFSIVKPSMIEGRYFNNNDLLLKRNVIILNKSVAQGLQLNINDEIYMHNSYYTLVGILEDTPDVLQTLYNVKTIKQNIDFTFNIYSLNLNSESFYHKIFVKLNEPLNIHNKTIIRQRMAFNKTDFEALTQYLTLEDFKEVLEENFQKNDKLLRTLIFCSFFVVSIFVLVMLTFTLKEKVYEVSVKKAVGAGVIDIITQILYENFIIGIISSIIAAYLSAIVISIIIPIMSIGSGMSLIYINIGHFLSPPLLIVVFLCAITVIPTVAVAKIKVISTLKYN